MAMHQYGLLTTLEYVCGSVWKDMEAEKTWKGKDNLLYERKLLKWNWLPEWASVMVA